MCLSIGLIFTTFQTFVLNRRFKLLFEHRLILMKIPLLSSYFLLDNGSRMYAKKWTRSSPAPPIWLIDAHYGDLC
ncbi:hypothetical protein SAMN06272722_109107 [Paenibacillus sp. RU5A]|nr:hypothetical protein SAMN06272722_109107 [Paenibacillus sp. RU5A]SOC73679.1 hypothetical protein SAMN05880581_109107 [Paenibacillus sp. RU26A]SOC75854.1 hypothetical protein SAMN05880586_109107 [Paenibacillus sp. RU5M]